MNSKLMTRREATLLGFSALVGCAFIEPAAMAQSSQGQIQLPDKRVRLPDGSDAPRLGMGAWRLGQGRRPIGQEEEAMRAGVSLGMTLIDTAEMYGNGASEEMIGRVIAGQRSDVFLVSKVLPSNATTAEGIRDACQRSLKRLDTGYLDLYLLHWRAQVKDLALVVDTFEELKRDGFIRRWGVSNFSISDMEELFRVSNGRLCTTNQVSYSLSDRAIERDVIPWSKQNNIPLMAYSPLGSNGHLLQNAVLVEIARNQGVSPAAIAIAWTMRNGSTISIPESGSVDHIQENARAGAISLSGQEVAALDRAFPV